MSPMLKRPANQQSGTLNRAARPAMAPAKPSPMMNRAANVPRMQQQAARQQGMQKLNQQVAPMRPAVRPVAAPRRIMPKQPAPAALRSVAAPHARVVARSVARPIVQAGKAAPRAYVPARRPVAPAVVVAGAAVVGVSAALFTLQAARAHADISSEVSSLQYSLTNLQDLSTFDDLTGELQQLDADIKNALNLLEAARDKGYRYQKDLNQQAVKIMDAWQGINQGTSTEIQKQSQAFLQTLTPLNTYIPRVNANLNNAAAAAPHLQAAETTVNNLLNEANRVRGGLQSRYASIQSEVSQLTYKLTTIHWVLTQLSEAKFTLEAQENIVMVVKARWDQQGDADPEGILHLTNKRLIFERKEKVATKKILFIATEKELVHELLFAEPVANINNSKAQSKGLFGHQDFLEVTFTGKLGAISLHLDGQDSKEWAVLVERVRNGKIEEDRAPEGGLSFADLTGQLTQADIVGIQAEVNAIQEVLLLSGARGELEALENSVRSLERDLGEVRAHGYQIEKNLEGEITVLASQWERTKSNAEKTLELQAGVLSEQAKSIQTLMGRLAGLAGNLAAARPVYMQLKSALASTAAQAGAAQETVYNQFDDYAAEVEGLAAHLDWVDWMLDAISTASFQLLATESGVAATEATYARPGMEPENGVLFLTDQRLIWEDRVGDYEVKVDVALAQVEGVTIEYVDEAQEDEVLAFQFGGGAPMGNAIFDIAAPVGASWEQMVGRARNGDYAADRAAPIDTAELDRIKNAPTQCTNCGGQFTSPVLRGQTEISCEFCGTIARI